MTRLEPTTLLIARLDDALRQHLLTQAARKRSMSKRVSTSTLRGPKYGNRLVLEHGLVVLTRRVTDAHLAREPLLCQLTETRPQVVGKIGLAADLREALLQEFLGGAFFERSAVERSLRGFNPPALMLVAEVRHPAAAVSSDECHLK